MRAKPRRRKTLAERADRHRLYERSVQDTAEELKLLAQMFQERRGRRPLTLREDFCGTALLACDWVRSDSRRSAVGVDIDEAVLAWGREHNVARLTARQRARIQLLNANVLSVKAPRSDLLVALNFSYWIFKRRDQMLEIIQQQ